MKELIIAAAIKSENGDIHYSPAPLRHCDVLCDMNALGVSSAGSTQGFLTDVCRFVTREEAYKIAKEAGQILKRADVTETPGVLYTEDLW